MVMLVSFESWGRFKEYAEKCRIGTYQVKEELEGKKVTVQAGRFAIVMGFDDLKDETQKQMYDEMLEFCRIQGFVEVEGSTTEEMLFI